MRKGIGFVLAALASAGCGVERPSADDELALTALGGEEAATVADPERVSAVWLLRTRDCFECPGIDRQVRDLRRVAAESAIPFSVVVFHIGQPNDSSTVRQHLRHARIDGTLVTMSRREARRIVPDLTAPDLLLVSGGLILWRRAWAIGERDRGASAEVLLGSANVRPLNRQGASRAIDAPRDTLLKIGQMLRIQNRHATEQDGELLGVVGRIDGCWTAFELGPRPEQPGAYLPIGPEVYESSRVYITQDSVYGGRRTGIDSLLADRKWILLDTEFVAERFIDCER